MYFPAEDQHRAFETAPGYAQLYATDTTGVYVYE
jgi:hypothetical protein